MPERRPPGASSLSAVPAHHSGEAGRVAFALAAAAFLVHGVAIGVGCGETGGRHLLTVSGAAGLVGWIAAGAFLGVQRAFGTPAAGVFALPLLASLVGVRQARATRHVAFDAVPVVACAGPPPRAEWPRERAAPRQPGVAYGGGVQ